MERMQQTAMNASRTPQQFISVMREEVAKFVGDAEQSDDLTMFAIQYKK
jgi:sigma-B regulation protein RsbU (phosphoserine phosphatase)